MEKMFIFLLEDTAGKKRMKTSFEGSYVDFFFVEQFVFQRQASAYRPKRVYCQEKASKIFKQS